MSNSDASSDLPLERWQQIDAACIRFEQQLRRGEAPDASRLAKEFPPEARPALLKELYALEAEYARKQAELGDTNVRDTAIAAAPVVAGEPTKVEPGRPPQLVVPTPTRGWSLRAKRFAAAAVAGMCIFVRQLIPATDPIVSHINADPPLEIETRGDRIVGVRHAETGEALLTGVRELSLTRARRHEGERIAFADGQTAILRQDGHEWVVIPLSRPTASADRDRQKPLPNAAAASVANVPVALGPSIPPVDQTAFPAAPSASINLDAARESFGRLDRWTGATEFFQQLLVDKSATLKPVSIEFAPPAQPRDKLLREVQALEAHHLETAQLRNWLENLPAGFHPVNINWEANSNPPRFNALALNDATDVPIRTLLDLVEPTASETYKTTDSSKWGVISETRFRINGELHQHHLWTEVNEAWGSWIYPSNDVDRMMQTWKSSGMRPIQIQVVSPPVKQGLAVFVLRPAEGREWVAKFDLTAQSAVQEVESARDTGWRPDCVALSGNGKEVWHSLVLLRNPKNESWSYRQNLTEEEFVAANAQEQTLGRRLRMAASAQYGGRQTLYSGIWIDAFDIPGPPVKERRRFEGFTQKNWVTRTLFTPDEKQILATSGKVLKWNAETGRTLDEFNPSDHFSWGLDVSKDGRFVVTSPDSGDLCLWDVETGAQLKRWSAHRRKFFFRSCFLTDSRTILSWGGDDKGAKIWNLRGELAGQLSAETPFEDLSATSDGRTVVVAGKAAGIQVWNVAERSLLRSLAAPEIQATTVSVTADGERAISGGADAIVRGWNLQDGTEIWRRSGHASQVFVVRIDPTGTRAMSGSDDGTVRIWDVRSGDELARWEATTRGANRRVADVRFSSDGRRALTGGFDGTVRLWDLPQEAWPISAGERSP